MIVRANGRQLSVRGSTICCEWGDRGVVAVILPGHVCSAIAAFACSSDSSRGQSTYRQWVCAGLASGVRAGSARNLLRQCSEQK